MTSPRIHPLLKRLWAIPTVRAVVWAVAVFILVDVVVFSPNGYLRLAEPKSYVGEIMARRRELKSFQNTAAPVKCAVLGDSRMAEGFSTQDADEYCRNDIVWFNASVSGSTPRTWYQILRSFQDIGCHFDIVFIPLPSFDGRTTEANLPNRKLDLQYTAPLVPRWRAISYARTFSDAETRKQALETTLCKSLAMRQDMAGFLQHPLRRLHSVFMQERHGSESRRRYKGNSASLAGTVHLGPDGLVFSESTSSEVRSSLQRSIKAVCRDIDETDVRYMDDWISRMISECRKTNTRIVFFLHPRGPFGPFYPFETGSWMEAKREDGVVLLPIDAFAGLENPSFFFDTVHMNALGRHEFTKRLVAYSRQILSDAPIQTVLPPIHVLDYYSESNIQRGFRQTDDNPWGKTVVCEEFPDFGRALLTTDSHFCASFGPFSYQLGKNIRFQTMAGFYPPAEKWGVSDGVTITISLLSGSDSRILWQRQCLPNDDDVFIDVPITPTDGVFFLQFETDDKLGNHTLGDWALWRDPVLLFQTDTAEDYP